MRALLGLAPVALLAVACSAADLPASGDEGDVGETTSRVTASCKDSRATLLANAGPERAAVISRGLAWFDAKVPYSQSKTHEGFRTDCSGFVSMCWSLKQSYTTADFAAGTADNSILGSYENLLPGDGFVRRSGGSGHAVLFVGWNDAAHTQACVLEEASTKSDMQFGVRAVSSLKSQGFKAMRADNLPAEAATTQTNATDPAAEDDGAPAGTAGATGTDDTTGFDDIGGAFDDTGTALDDGTGAANTGTSPADATIPAAQGDACTDDNTCNPHFAGTGLICSTMSSTCVPGCRFDLQCPGAQLCVSGHCK